MGFGFGFERGKEVRDRVNQRKTRGKRKKRVIKEFVMSLLLFRIKLCFILFFDNGSNRT